MNAAEIVSKRGKIKFSITVRWWFIFSIILKHHTGYYWSKTLRCTHFILLSQSHRKMYETVFYDFYFSIRQRDDNFHTWWGKIPVKVWYLTCNTAHWSSMDMNTSVGHHLVKSWNNFAIALRMQISLPVWVNGRPARIFNFIRAVALGEETFISCISTEHKQFNRHAPCAQKTADAVAPLTGSA